ncbi:GntR family transcriptional regulator [Aminipila luticellarii]|uniref:GntR family transcriptional regulator n=1 Tax=Aminipila luticellarii TaxID=2507160 RepID=A0A410PYA6_9FIRM|nr:GntR family transcriptional regulator [Aminipila luticellarii]QAT43933.1 GntR family transcriptional regulator [Aminipila luticellarii]
MNIIISNSNSQPIYEQIVHQIKNQILTKDLVAGDALPSMRLLAKELKISVITTKRAYEELEKEGFIESYTGKGSFVKAQNEQQLREQHIHEINIKLQEIIELAHISHIEISDVIDQLKHLQKGE